MERRIFSQVNSEPELAAAAAMVADAGNGNDPNDGRPKRMKRKEILEKKKAIQEIVKAASSSTKGPLSFFPSFGHYQNNGLSVFLESGCGNKLSCYLKQCIQNLLKINMEGPYGSEWPSEEKMKRREMVAPEARYIFVYEASKEDATHISQPLGKGRNSAHCIHAFPIVGFVHYRFTIEEEIPVLYIYELQLEPRIQGNGLGEFLMQLIEHIARENSMGAVMLTVQKANSCATKFYTRKLRYNISSISPSRVNTLIGLEKNYEILCKVFDNEAKAVLEDGWTEEK